MKWIAVSQRVVVDRVHGERRDALDQRWQPLLNSAGLVPLILPNTLEDVWNYMLGLPVEGLLLTGGNDLPFPGAGSDAPERDATETAAFGLALEKGWPVLGICRGAQFIVRQSGGAIRELEGHVGTRHRILASNGCVVDLPLEVGSYHRFGVSPEDLPKDLRVLAVAEDGSAEAFEHIELPMHGLMWHPEREEQAKNWSQSFLRRFFRVPG